MKNTIIYFLFLISACSNTPRRETRPSPIASIDSTEEILLSQKVPAEKVPDITYADLKKDISTLLFTLDRAYGGRAILPGSQYRDLIQNLNALKDKDTKTSSDQLCDKLAAIFSKVNDYHNTVKIGQRACGGSWPKGTVGSNSGSGDKNRTWSFFSRKYHQASVPILSLRTMSPDASPDWRGFLQTVQDLARSKKSFIIDLRGNGGGSTTNAFEMVRALYGLDKKDDLPWPKKQVYHLQTPESWALTANYYWLTMQEYENNNLSLPEYIPNAYRKFVQLNQDAKKGLMPPVEIRHLGGASPNLKNAATAQIYVLIDRGCGSTCELVLEALEHLPAVHTVGERTTGVVQYGYAGWLFLPASHVVVQLSTQGTRYDDQRHVEKVGYAPKSPVPSGSDALKFTLAQFFN